jgi:hypothetical protein
MSAPGADAPAAPPTLPPQPTSVPAKPPPAPKRTRPRKEKAAAQDKKKDKEKEKEKEKKETESEPAQTKPTVSPAPPPPPLREWIKIRTQHISPSCPPKNKKFLMLVLCRPPLPICPRAYISALPPSLSHDESLLRFPLWSAPPSSVPGPASPGRSASECSSFSSPAICISYAPGRLSKLSRLSPVPPAVDDVPPDATDGCSVSRLSCSAAASASAAATSTGGIRIGVGVCFDRC